MGFVGPVQRAAFQADAAPGTGYEPGSEEEAGFEDGASFEQDHDLIMAEAQRLCSGGGAAALLPADEVLRSDSALVCVRFAALASMAVREKLPLPYACTATGGAAPPMDETLAWVPTADTACLRERDQRQRKQLE